MENIGGESRRMLGERVALFRTRAGMTQTELAEQLQERGYDIKQPTITKLETGKRPTPTDEVETLSRIFNVTVSDLLGLTDDEGELINLMIDSHRAEERVRAARQRMLDANDRYAEIKLDLEAAEKITAERYAEWQAEREKLQAANAKTEEMRKRG